MRITIFVSSYLLHWALFAYCGSVKQRRNDDGADKALGIEPEGFGTRYHGAPPQPPLRFAGAALFAEPVEVVKEQLPGLACRAWIEMEAIRNSRHDIYEKGENKFQRRLRWMAAVLVENGNAGGSLVYFSSSMLPSTSPIQLEDARNNRLHEGLSSALRACEASYGPRDDAGLGCPEIFALQETMSNRPQLPGDQDSRFSGFLSVCGRGEFNGRGVAQLKKSCPGNLPPWGCVQMLGNMHVTTVGNPGDVPDLPELTPVRINLPHGLELPQQQEAVNEGGCSDGENGELPPEELSGFPNPDEYSWFPEPNEPGYPFPDEHSWSPMSGERPWGPNPSEPLWSHDADEDPWFPDADEEY